MRQAMPQSAGQPGIAKDLGRPFGEGQIGGDDQRAARGRVVQMEVSRWQRLTKTV